MDEKTLDKIKHEILKVFQHKEKIVFKPLSLESIESENIYIGCHRHIYMRLQIYQEQKCIDWITN